MDAQIVVPSAGTVAAPYFDHVLYTEAKLVADGRLVHGLPSKMMLYVGLWENAAHYGWNMERVDQFDTCGRDIRKMIYDTRKLKLLEQMRSIGYDC